MSAEINTGATQAQQLDLNALARGLGADGAGIKATMQELAPILSASLNLSVTRANGTGSAQRNASVALDLPVLDDAEPVALTVDLEALIAYLQIENDEQQLEVSKTRIEALKGGIEADHLSTQESIDKSIKEAQEAEEAAKKQKRLGIIGALIGLVATVVIGIVTGGVAVAAISVAVMAVMVVLEKSGANEAMAKGLSEFLQKCGVPKDTADKIGKLVVGVTELVAALVIMIKSPAMVKGIKARLAERRAVKAAAKVAVAGAGAAVGASVAKTAATTAAKTAAKTAGKGAGKGAGAGGKSVAKEGDELVGEKPPVKEGEAKVEKKASAEKGDDAVEMDDLDVDGKKVEAPEGPAGDSELDLELQKIEKEAQLQKKGQIAQSAVMGATSVAGMAAGIYTGVQNEQAEEAAAAVKEAQAFLREFQTRLEDEEDTLLAILQMMNENMASLADILESQSNADAEIASHIGG